MIFMNANLGSEKSRFSQGKFELRARKCRARMENVRGSRSVALMVGIGVVNKYLVPVSDTVPIRIRV